jgi:hypothetical protein
MSYAAAVASTLDMTKRLQKSQGTVLHHPFSLPGPAFASSAIPSSAESTKETAAYTSKHEEESSDDILINVEDDDDGFTLANPKPFKVQPSRYSSNFFFDAEIFFLVVHGERLQKEL